MLPVSDVLGAAGASPEIVWGERAYRLGHPTQKAKAAFCDMIVDAEFRGIQEALKRGFLTEAKADAAVERLGRQVDRRGHQPGGELFAKYGIGAEGVAGTELFVLSLFRENHPAMTLGEYRDLAEARPDEVKLAVRKVVPLFFEWVLEKGSLTPAQKSDIRAKIPALVDAAFGPGTPSGSP